MMSVPRNRQHRDLQRTTKPVTNHQPLRAFAAKDRAATMRNSTRPFDKSRKKERITSAHVAIGKHWHHDFATRLPVDYRSLYKETQITIQKAVKEDSDTDEDTGIETESERSQDDLFDQQSVLEFFTEDIQHCLHSWETKTIRRYLLDPVTLAASSNAWAWVDDRCHSTGHTREYSDKLNAMDLRRILSRDRLNCFDLPNVDRRLIYVSNPTPEFMLTLFEAANWWESDALKQGLSKYVNLEASFRVHLPAHGALSFCMDFHLTYPILRETCEQTAARPEPFADLSFLPTDSSAEPAANLNVYQAHISIILCGRSDKQWTAYAFVKNEFETQQEDEEEHGEDYCKQDLLACELDDGHIRDANLPIWDARKYWLYTVNIRCQTAVREWKYVVGTVEERLETWKANDPCRTNKLTYHDSKDIQTSLNCTLQAMDLLRRLLDCLSMTLREYMRLSATDGDICYFADLCDSRTRQVKDNIKQSFEQLSELNLRLQSLDDSCNRFATHLGRILNVESNRLAAENNSLSQESRDLNRQARQLGELTHELNEKIRKLNEESTFAVRASQEAAAKTSLSTRVNVELLLLTTPFGMVLQYFSTDKDVFSINRSPKTFVLATIILMVILRLISLLLEHYGKLIRYLPLQGKSKHRPSQSFDGVSGIELQRIQPV